MDKSKWVWMPHAGHFILGDRCKFKLNTYVGKYIVSTVGELWNPEGSRRIHAKIHDARWYAKHFGLKGDNFDHEYMSRFGYEDIGCDRKYETMVFKAQKAKDTCCPYRIIVADEVDFNAYNNSKDATKGHMKLCKKWSVK